MGNCNLHPDWACRGLAVCGECQDWPTADCPYCGQQREKERRTPGSDPKCSFCGLRETDALEKARDRLIQILSGCKPMTSSQRDRLGEIIYEALFLLREWEQIQGEPL